ncbi:hypothetical protein GE09DRAFT_132778 [Coniochaeta sp. 2T2.1]|nr:hypothetical protein GE09DRAFT_132778 [Coniochaeta sp. 2T2.1]
MPVLKKSSIYIVLCCAWPTVGHVCVTPHHSLVLLSEMLQRNRLVEPTFSAALFHFVFDPPCFRSACKVLCSSNGRPLAYIDLKTTSNVNFSEFPARKSHRTAQYSAPNHGQEGRVEWGQWDFWLVCAIVGINATRTG